MVIIKQHILLKTPKHNPYQNHSKSQAKTKCRNPFNELLPKLNHVRIDQSAANSSSFNQKPSSSDECQKGNFSRKGIIRKTTTLRYHITEILALITTKIRSDERLPCGATGGCTRAARRWDRRGRGGERRPRPR